MGCGPETSIEHESLEAKPSVGCQREGFEQHSTAGNLWLTFKPRREVWVVMEDTDWETWEI